MSPIWVPFTVRGRGAYQPIMMGSLTFAIKRRNSSAYLGLVFPSVHRDVEVGDLGQRLAGQVRGELGVVHQGGEPLVGVGLVEVDLGHVGPVTGHRVVRLVAGELEAVVAAGSSPGVELVAAQTSHQSGLAGLKIFH